MTDIFLYQGEVNPSDIKLSDPTVVRGGVVAINYTLPCDVGNYTYTGQAATLQVVHGLVCATGAYVYTGQAATLQVRHSLACAAGAYTYTGQAATLQVVHGLSCATGSYSYSGQAATLSVVHSLVCAVGAYTYTGNDATLTYVPGAAAVNYTLACDAGSYTYTGQDAVLTYVLGTVEQPLPESPGANSRRRAREEWEIKRRLRRKTLEIDRLPEPEPAPTAATPITGSAPSPDEIRQAVIQALAGTGTATASMPSQAVMDSVSADILNAKAANDEEEEMLAILITVALLEAA